MVKLYGDRLNEYVYVVASRDPESRLILYGIFDDIVSCRQFKRIMERKHFRRLLMVQYPLYREHVLK